MHCTHSLNCSDELPSLACTALHCTALTAAPKKAAKGAESTSRAGRQAGAHGGCTWTITGRYTGRGPAECIQWLRGLGGGNHGDDIHSAPHSTPACVVFQRKFQSSWNAVEAGGKGGDYLFELGASSLSSTRVDTGQHVVRARAHIC